MSSWPFWTRELDGETVTFVLTADQAIALAEELDGLRDIGRYRPRIDELCHCLTWDAYYLRRKQ